MRRRIRTWLLDALGLALIIIAIVGTLTVLAALRTAAPIPV